MFDPDYDNDPEKPFEKHQTLKLTTLTFWLQWATVKYIEYRSP
jgi:hypothetical protein